MRAVAKMIKTRRLQAAKKSPCPSIFPTFRFPLPQTPSPIFYFPSRHFPYHFFFSLCSTVQSQKSGWFGIVVKALVMSTKLSYVEPS